MRKALKLQVHDYEVYSSHVGLGKLTFIRYMLSYCFPSFSTHSTYF